MINLLTATKEDLLTVDGITNIKAIEIIAGLEDGTIQSIDDLIKIKGIGQKTLEKIKTQLIWINEAQEDLLVIHNDDAMMTHEDYHAVIGGTRLTVDTVTKQARQYYALEQIEADGIELSENEVLIDVTYYANNFAHLIAYERSECVKENYLLTSAANTIEKIKTEYLRHGSEWNYTGNYIAMFENVSWSNSKQKETATECLTTEDVFKIGYKAIAEFINYCKEFKSAYEDDLIIFVNTELFRLEKLDSETIRNGLYNHSNGNGRRFKITIKDGLNYDDIHSVRKIILFLTDKRNEYKKIADSIVLTKNVIQRIKQSV